MKSIRIKIVEDGETVYDKENDWNQWMDMHKRGGGSPFCVQTDGRNYMELTIK